MRHPAATLGALLALLAWPAPAAATNGWEAKWLGQSEYPTLESGETVTSAFDAQNVGSKTWTQANTLLGTSAPRDRHSAFFVPGTWRSDQRVVPIDREVPPGATGRFVFPMHAPEVASTTTLREYFEPVADDPADSGWMGENGQWSGVYLDYTVLPAENPVVQLNSAPLSVDQGQPIELTATASDNRAVSRVTFSVRDRPIEVEGRAGDARSYSGALDSSALAPGVYTVAVRAQDPAGHASEATTRVTVREPPPPSPPPVAKPSPRAAPAWTIGLRTFWRFSRGTTRVRTLTLSRLAADARITVRCRGRGCRSKRRTVAARGRRVLRLARYLRGQRLRPGARIVLTVARPGRGARSFTFRMRRGRLPAARERCRSADGRAVRCGR